MCSYISTAIFIFVFIFGLIIGSFLNVVILRHNTGKSLAGRSGCMSCNSRLGVFELIPVVSFLFQKGRCRHCRSSISKQYIIVELASGFLTLVSFLYIHVWTYSLAFLWEEIIGFLLLIVINSLLLIIGVYDFKHKIIPHSFVYSFFALAIIWTFLNNYAVMSYGDIIWDILVGILSTALPIFTLWFFSKGRAMGFGDVQLMLGIGAILGWQLGITSLIYAFNLGAIYGIILMIKDNIKIKSEVPFGPFLIIAFWITLFTNIDVLSLLNVII